MGFSNERERARKEWEHGSVKREVATKEKVIVIHVVIGALGAVSEDLDT